MRTDPSRFDRVVEHPDYERVPEQPVLPADAVGVAAAVGPMTVTLFAVVFFLIVVTLVLQNRPPLAVSIFLIGGALVVLLGGIGGIHKLVEFRNAPIHRHVAVIIKERSEVTMTKHSRSRTHYYATLQLRDGNRVELHTYRSLVGRIVVDDIGVAYVKSRTLVEFIRFDVD
jgi:hypothetical protein